MLASPVPIRRQSTLSAAFQREVLSRLHVDVEDTGQEPSGESASSRRSGERLFRCDGGSWLQTALRLAPAGLPAPPCLSPARLCHSGLASLCLSFCTGDRLGPGAAVTRAAEDSGRAPSCCPLSYWRSVGESCNRVDPFCGQQEAVLWGDGLVLYPDYGGSYSIQT